jgi:hypothetical protein
MRMRNTRTYILIAAIIAIALAIPFIYVYYLKYCYELASSNGLKTIPYATQFATLYPDSKHSYTYYTGAKGSPVWNSTTGLYGRYILSMEVDVSFDSSRTTVVSYGSPTFLLKEIASTSVEPNGNFSYRAGETQVRFGEAEWSNLVEHNGDLSSLGIQVKKDSPITEFDRCWR